MDAETGDTKVSNAELEHELHIRSAQVVHFSHHANMPSPHAGMRDEFKVFPADMLNAIAISQDKPLSCTVVWPGCSFRPVGSVGVIFAPKAANVMSVCATDAGTSTGSDGADVSYGAPLDRISLLSTFECNDRYNEWRVKGAQVVGIYVEDVKHICAKRPAEFAKGEIGPEPVTLPQVFDWLPGWKVFTFHGAQRCEVFRDGTWKCPS